MEQIYDVKCTKCCREYMEDTLPQIAIGLNTGTGKETGYLIKQYPELAGDPNILIIYGCSECLTDAYLIDINTQEESRTGRSRKDGNNNVL